MAETKKRRKKINITRLITSIIVVAMVVAIGLSVKNILTLHSEQRELKEQNEKLNQQKAELTTELENVNDLEYIEEQARKQLKMIKPGEVLFVLDDVAKNAGQGDSQGEGEEGGNG